MDFSVPPISNYVYVLIRLKRSDKINDIVQGTLRRHYGGTNDASLVGDLVQPSKTLMAGAIRHALSPSCQFSPSTKRLLNISS
jgi:hypothetical protein